MDTQTAPHRQSKWGWLLTRDRMFCVICFKQAQLDQAANGPYPASEIATRVWVRIANPRRECNPIDPKTRRAYFAETRRAFKAHVREQHPEWMDRIDWTHRT